MGNNVSVMGDLYVYRRKKAILMLLFCAFCFLVTLTCVVICLLEQPSEATPERGELVFHLFTVNSNLVFAFGCAICLPFAVEGLRKDRVHIPTWCLWFLYVGVSSVSLTFLFAVALILPVKGIGLAFGGTNFFLHLACPLLAIVLFTVLASDHKMKFKETFIGMIFFGIYAVVYAINVVIIGESNGGWRDVYQLNTRLPLIVSILLMVTLSFLVSFCLRLIHNKTCRMVENNTLNQIKKHTKINESSPLREVVFEIADQAKINPHIVNIPIDDLTAISDIIGSKATSKELCEMYLDGYYSEDKINHPNNKTAQSQSKVASTSK